ncbi:MAG: porin [Gammaproteobacteria bacterium]|nr:porin [Gammaproteobacteria bacterium]
MRVMPTLTTLALLVAANSASAESGTPDIADLINDGAVKLALRYRYEGVDDDAFDEDARASTLRTRLTLESGSYLDFSGALEFDNISEVIADDFNAGAGNTPDRTEYPVVADPDGTEINQLYIDYKGFEHMRLRLGRQRIALDNHRFIGNVGWRQNEQTYDAFSTTWDRETLHVNYAYVDGVRRIFGEEVSAGREEQDNTNLLNARLDIAAVGALSGYYYHIDSHDNPATSTGTFGVRLAGQQQLDEVGLRYAAEIAHQRDAGDNPASYDANYFLLDGGVIIDNFDIGFGWEVLEGNEGTTGEAFATPFATLHAFNGWADKFLSTPAEGLDDKYFKAKATFGALAAEFAYHRFEGQDSSDDLGAEWDVAVGYQFHPRVRGDLKFAAFNGDDPRYSDTTKFWVMISATLP